MKVKGMNRHTARRWHNPGLGKQAKNKISEDNDIFFHKTHLVEMCPLSF
jgi:hypothetical protein